MCQNWCINIKCCKFIFVEIVACTTVQSVVPTLIYNMYILHRFRTIIWHIRFDFCACCYFSRVHAFVCVWKRVSGEFVGLISCILAVVWPQDNIAKFDLELSLSFPIHTDGVGVCVCVFLMLELMQKIMFSLSLSLFINWKMNIHSVYVGL